MICPKFHSWDSHSVLPWRRVDLGALGRSREVAQPRAPGGTWDSRHKPQQGPRKARASAEPLWGSIGTEAGEEDRVAGTQVLPGVSLWSSSNVQTPKGNELPSTHPLKAEFISCPLHEGAVLGLGYHPEKWK